LHKHFANGQRLLDVNRTIGQSNKITTIFDRKVTKYYKGKLQTGDRRSGSSQSGDSTSFFMLAASRLLERLNNENEIPVLIRIMTNRVETVAKFDP